jgi:hypothetical protein
VLLVWLSLTDGYYVELGHNYVELGHNHVSPDRYVLVIVVIIIIIIIIIIIALPLDTQQLQIW